MIEISIYQNKLWRARYRACPTSYRGPDWWCSRAVVWRPLLYMVHSISDFYISTSISSTFLQVGLNVPNSPLQHVFATLAHSSIIIASNFPKSYKSNSLESLYLSVTSIEKSLGLSLHQWLNYRGSRHSRATVPGRVLGALRPNQK